jgi:tetratricopeptide (TPR) repeat protein
MAACFTRHGSAGLRALGFGMAWFFIAYAPCTGIIIPVNAIFLEHWMYLPAAGLFIGVAEGTARLLRHETAKAAAIILSAVTVLCFGMFTLQQNALWRDPITFYSHILNYEEGSGRLHNNLAMAYDDVGRDDLAMEHYQKAIALEDHYAQTHYNLGRLYLKMGRLEEAKAEMHKALAIDPGFYRASEILNAMEKPKTRSVY